MKHPPKFRFFFEKNGTRTVIQNAPMEWNDNIIQWKRDALDKPTMAQFVTEFTFVLEDRQYLVDCFDTEGVFAAVKFIAEERDNDFIYHPYYSGDVDFYSYQEDALTVKVIAAALEFKTMFDANYDVSYEIPIPNARAQMAYDRVSMLNADAWESKLDYNVNSNPDSSIATTIDIALESSIYQEENTTKGNVFNSYVQAGERDEKDKITWLAKIIESTGVQIAVNFELTYEFLGPPQPSYVLQDFSAGLEFRLMVGGMPCNLCIRKNITTPAGESVSGQLNFPIGIIFSEATVFLGVLCTVKGRYYNTDLPAQPVYMHVVIKSTEKITLLKKGPPATIKCLPAIDILTSLIYKATKGKYDNVDYSFLTSSAIGSSLLITSGNGIRNMTGAKIKTSLKEFFESMRVMLGMTYYFRMVDGQQKLILCHVDDAFIDTEIVSVTGVKDYKRSVDNGNVYNSLRFGYRDNAYEEINGKCEFSTELEYAIETSGESKKLELVSAYRADMYGIDFTLINYDGKETTDSNSDNDTFVFHGQLVSQTPFRTYIPNRAYTDPSAMAASSAFNVALSPARCLRRQLRYIKSLFQFSGSVLSFASSKKDYNMTSKAPDGSAVTENDSIDLSGVQAIFDPVFHEFETIVPTNVNELVGATPGGYVTLIHDGKTIRGYVSQLKENPGREKSQIWKLVQKA
jgi:hypothetical protein